MKILQILEDYRDSNRFIGKRGSMKLYNDAIEAISELEALQQHIKNLESQLSSNPLQLTCDGCKWNGSVYEDWSEHCGNCARNVIQEDDMFETKDTK